MSLEVSKDLLYILQGVYRVGLQDGHQNVLRVFTKVSSVDVEAPLLEECDDLYDSYMREHLPDEVLADVVRFIAKQ